MTVLLGYVPTPEGNAAFAHALAEAARRSTDLILVNSARAGAHVDGCSWGAHTPVLAVKA